MRQSLTAARNAGVGFFFQGVTILVSFLLVPFIVHWIGEEAYGVFILAFSISRALELLRNPLVRACTVSVAHCKETGEDEQANRTIGAAIIFTLIPAVLGLLIFAGGGGLITRFFSVPSSLELQARLAMGILGVGMLLSFPLYPFQGVLWGLQRHDIAYTVMGVHQVIRAVLIVLVFWFFRGDIVTVMAVTVLASVSTQVVMVLLSYRIWPSLRVRLRQVSKQDFKPVAAFGSLLLLTQVLLILDVQGGVWIVGKALGVEYITHLWVTYMIVKTAYRLVQQVTIALVPIAARYHALQQQGLLQEMLTRGCRYSFLIAAGLLCGLLPQMDVFLRLWMKEPFVWLALYVIVLGCVTAVTASSSCSLQILQGMGDAKRPFWAVLVATTGGLGTMLISVVFFKAGFGGIVAGVCVSQLLRWALLTGAAVRKVGVSPGKFAWHAFGAPLIALVPAVAAAQSMRWYLQPSTWVMLFAIMLTATVTFYLSMMLFFTKEEWCLVRAIADKVYSILRRKDKPRKG